MKILNKIRDLYYCEDKIGEDRYKQRLFLDFFKELGYEDKEIRFEDLIRGSVYESDKFVDVLCGDILLEVKSSNLPLNKEVLKQAFLYNQGVGVNIVGVTNFKKFQFYDKSVNNLILEFEIENYEDNLHHIYRLLGKYTFNSYEDYISYDLKMDTFYEIKNMLSEYMEEYHNNCYENLPIVFKENISLLVVLRKLSKLKHINSNLNLKLDKEISKLFEIIEILIRYQGLKYFSSSINGERVYHLHPDFLNSNSPMKFEVIKNIKQYIEYIDSFLYEIINIDNKIRYWNDKIWNMHEHYKRMGELY